MVRSGRGAGSEVLWVEGSSRQVEEGWRMAERRRIWERRKAVLSAGRVFAWGAGVGAASIVVCWH